MPTEILRAADPKAFLASVKPRQFLTIGNGNSDQPCINCGKKDRGRIAVLDDLFSDPAGDKITLLDCCKSCAPDALNAVGAHVVYRLGDIAWYARNA